jgi:hypothetical protein
MAKSQRLSDDELLAAIDAAEQVAIGATQGDISADRSDAVDRYLGRQYSDETLQAGRSTVVSRDVADVVEGVLANVIKPFIAGDQLVQFDPIGPEDEDQAQQETDYINWIALERNNGFLVLTSAVKDALLLRNGYVKCNWTKRSDVIIEAYTGQSDEEVALLLQDAEIEVAEHAEYPDPTGAIDQMGQPVGMLHDIKVRRKRPTEYVEVIPIPPDEVLVSSRATSPSVQDVDFVQHRVELMLSDVRQMGYQVDDDIGSDDDTFDMEEYSRSRFGSLTDDSEDPTQDPARRLILFKETWIRVDRDGDGIAELRRVCQIGKTLLADEEADIVPIACGTGTIMSHQHLGVSTYDMVVDIARLKTALTRSYMDGKYLSTQPRMVVNVDTVNMDDLMISRPGGIIRTTGIPGTDVVPLLTPDTGASALQGLEYLDSVRENRTGYTRYAQGMDSDSLVNKTATGAMQAMSQSQLRLEMISRTIAETLLRDMFRIIHALTLKHSTKKEKVRLKNKWVEINPRSWVKRTDLQISVGLGSGTGDQMLQKLMALNPMMQQAQMMGLAGPTEAYNYGAEILKAAGFKNPDRFIHAPPTGPDGKPIPAPQQPNPLVQVEQIKQQSAHALKDKELHFQAQQGGQEAQADMALERYKVDSQMQFEQFKANLDAQTRLQIAEMQVRSSAAIAAQRQVDGNPNNGELRQ